MIEKPVPSEGSVLLDTARSGVADSLNCALDSIADVQRKELADRLQPANNAINYAKDCSELVEALASIPRLLRDPLAFPNFIGRLSVRLTDCARDIRSRSYNRGLSEGDSLLWFECGDRIWEAASEIAEWCAQEGEAI